MESIQFWYCDLAIAPIAAIVKKRRRCICTIETGLQFQTNPVRFPKKYNFPKERVLRTLVAPSKEPIDCTDLQPSDPLFFSYLHFPSNAIWVNFASSLTLSSRSVPVSFFNSSNQESYGRLKIGSVSDIAASPTLCNEYSG